ncbi:MAG: DUF4230 domain-containing protein [Anaerolineae bacterium]|nr:DUF4230 domain-containing protein [Anaerolineae bacterium]
MRGKRWMVLAADLWILVCAAAVLLAFFILPWLVSATGYRILTGTQNVPQSVVNPPTLFLVPLAGGVALFLMLWGALAPIRKRIAAWLIALFALGGLFYFFQFITSNGGSMAFTGTGFWIALLAMLGLLLQIAAPRPRLRRLRDDERRPPDAGKADSSGRYSFNAGRVVGNVVAAPVRAALSPFRFGCLVAALAFGMTVACALALPSTFEAVINSVRNASRLIYVRVLEVTGSPALKVTTYDVNVTAYTRVDRDMGMLGALFGEGAEVTGDVRIGLGADLLRDRAGILSCEINTDTLQTYVSRAALAGTAFDQGEIEREAYRAFREEAARIAIEQYWPEARRRLRENFIAWGLGFEVPEAPEQAICPTFEESQGAPADADAATPAAGSGN